MRFCIFPQHHKIVKLIYIWKWTMNLDDIPDAIITISQTLVALVSDVVRVNDSLDGCCSLDRWRLNRLIDQYYTQVINRSLTKDPFIAYNILCTCYTNKNSSSFIKITLWRKWINIPFRLVVKVNFLIPTLSKKQHETLLRLYHNPEKTPIKAQSNYFSTFCITKNIHSCEILKLKHYHKWYTPLNSPPTTLLVLFMNFDRDGL